jgi:hypothetical protein
MPERAFYDTVVFLLSLKQVDPHDKARRGSKKRGTAVRDLLRDQIGVEPMYPAEALARMRAG